MDRPSSQFQVRALNGRSAGPGRQLLVVVQSAAIGAVIASFAVGRSPLTSGLSWFVDRACQLSIRSGMAGGVEPRGGGGVVTEFVQFTLDDGSVVMFESADRDLVAKHGGAVEVREGGKLTARLRGVAEAAEEISESLRSRLAPDEVSLEFGLKVSGEMSWWFFAKAATEGTIKVTLKWSGSSLEPSSGTEPGAGACGNDD